MHTRWAKASPALAGTTALVLFAFLVSSPSIRGQALPSGRAIPLTVRDGRCECILPTSNPQDKFFLIVGSASREPGPYRVTVQTEATERPARISEEDILTSISVVAESPDPATPWHGRETVPQHVEEYPPADEPLRTKKFFLFVKERDFYNPENYVTVSAELQELGRHCQVYVDRDYEEQSRLRPTIDDIVRTFDNEVYPRACRSLGRTVDVDRDGRFTILLTPWLGKLAGGKASLGGFVRGSDFFRDLAPPYGNRCDMMYLNTDLSPGPTLQTILAHEYTHAVIFSEHVFGSYQPQASGQDEEGWLNEGLAHVVEDLHGYSWSNLDYRISAFLSAPERYQLTVADYFQAGLFRSHGHRGAAYLFLRWCCHRYGEDLLKQLVQTNLTGTANVEAATHERFANLFRQWTIALALSGTNLAEEKTAEIRRIGLHQPLGGRLLCGPRFHEMILAGGKYEASLAGTSAAYLLLHSPGKSNTRLRITTEPESRLQVTLLRLPDRTGRLELLPVPGGKGPLSPNREPTATALAEAPTVAAGSGLNDSATPTVRLQLTARDQDMILEQAAWERLVPTSNRPEDTSYRPPSLSPRGSAPGRRANEGARTDLDDSIQSDTIQAWFGDPRLKSGETRTSIPITIPPSEFAADSWVFKVSATDAAGHHLSAWVVK